MAELLLATDDGSEAWYAHWGELALALAWREMRADLIWVDAPYSARTHCGHNRGVMTAAKARAWAKRALANGARQAPRDVAHALQQGERRRITYDAWTPRDVRAFVRTWAPLCAGWFVTITDHVLAPWWSRALARAGLYVFSPIAYVASGSRVRMTGDGPPTWCCTVIHARVRTRSMARWGTAEARAARGDAPPLLGAYVLPQGEGGRLDVVGGKPPWLHEAIVTRYSAPDGLVVDPCAGGGGAGVAAVRHGRRAIVGDVLRGHADLSEEALRSARPITRATAIRPRRVEQGLLNFGVPG